MPVFIPDASVTVPWCARDEASPWADSLLERLRVGDTALVPAIWVYAVANTVLHLKQRARIGDGEMSRFLDDLRALPIKVDSEGIERVFDRVLVLAGRHRITVYDACYLELALRTGYPLATQDRDRERAAHVEQAPLVKRP